MKHSQGPWIKEIWNDGICRIWDKHGQQLICKIAPYAGNVFTEEEKNNIDLIQSLPSILEENEKLKKQIKNYRARFGDDAAQEKCEICGDYDNPSLIESSRCKNCINK